ncbi:hypothetical protein C6497_06740 [Candidatus Poribacteria bacterium]|nr:MAG: hypothetical protein C6497_06740 [Candidatus Poribacteria bacterium]
MKLTKLKLKNINSFREEVEIDFENPPLSDASLVAITGPTGAGKTTLLDAICVALYSKTPRLNSTGTQNPRHLISQGEKEGFVEVHFIADNTRYITEWSAQRKSSPSGQLINADNGQLITDRLSNQGKSLGSSENSVSEEITSILGLDFDAFKRSIMLAQGEFAAFLKAKNEERRIILEAAADVDIYEALKLALNEQVNEVETAYRQAEANIDAIPDVSPEQLAEAKAELGKLQAESEKLSVEEQSIQENKDKETERKEAYEKLQDSEKRKKELDVIQEEINDKKIELEQSERANQLSTEKLLYDTAKSDRERVSQDLKQAEKELSDAELQVGIHQAESKSKNEEYLKVEEENNNKISIYNSAILDVKQAENQFEQVRVRTTSRDSLNNQIDTLTKKLSEHETCRGELEKKISETQTYLEENPLPSDRNQRLNRATAILVEINALQEQKQGKIHDQSEYSSQISELEKTVEKLTQRRKELQSEGQKTTELHQEIQGKYNTLLNAGTPEEWQSRRENARKAQPIAQQYEFTKQQLDEGKEKFTDLNAEIKKLDVEIDKIKQEIEDITSQYESDKAEVEKLESEKQSALLSDPVNQLRHQLEDGKPCRVCGATHHPYAGQVERESEDLIDIQKRLDKAESVAKKALKKKQDLEQQHTRELQNKSNTSESIEECQQEINSFTTEMKDLLEKWQDLYDSTDVSSQMVDERIDEIDKAIDSLEATREKKTELSNSLTLISQKLDTCESDYSRENDALEQTKQDLKDATSDIEDIKEDISNIEQRFWDTMPNDFHGTTPDEAKQQFEDRIETVGLREQELTSNNADLDVLNTNIKNDQQSLEGENTRLFELNKEIQKYQNQGDRLIGVVKEKTGGLETEQAINSAIKKFEEEIEKKQVVRDEAETQLQKSRNLLTEKETTHRICNEKMEESNDSYEEAMKTYQNKLAEVGFTSSEEHEKALREETQIQELRDTIEEHETEIQQLNSDIDKLQSIFEQNPYDSKKLTEIEEQDAQIKTKIQKTTEKLGSQNQIIKNLKDTLKKREEVSEELSIAKKEFDRWKQLQEIIPQNHLRDFALDIMFKQVSRIANAYLTDLTSERYQLKVENIGRLSVIDRWNANEERPVETLSGGESFLTSLALALALSELSKGRSQLNSLFLDEGFGTLDAETLDVAVAALETLRSQGRKIYLISHIQALTNRLPVKINVRKRGNSSSIEIR